VKSAAFGLGLILLALPFSVCADENLVAKREACRQEARTRIVPKGKIGVDEYRRLVERRNVHVSQCMARVVVSKAPPPPPKKVAQDTTEIRGASVISPSKKKSHRAAQRAERRKLKVASIRTSKGKRLKRLSRRSK